MCLNHTVVCRIFQYGMFYKKWHEKFEKLRMTGENRCDMIFMLGGLRAALIFAEHMQGTAMAVSQNAPVSWDDLGEKVTQYGFADHDLRIVRWYCVTSFVAMPVILALAVVALTAAFREAK